MRIRLGMRSERGWGLGLGMGMGMGMGTGVGVGTWVGMRKDQWRWEWERGGAERGKVRQGRVGQRDTHTPFLGGVREREPGSWQRPFQVRD